MPYARLSIPILIAACLSWSTLAGAQTGAPANATDAGGDAPSGTRAERRIERIVIEDAGSRVDELRVGGETQNITVTPKGGMPSYEVTPGGANRSLTNGERVRSSASAGSRVWKVLSF